ncbi:MAG TPA: hypothetical protein VF462_03350 [Micromonosporaceae bacterium]
MVSVTTLQSDDRPGWEELFCGYNAFYGRTWPADRYDWAWQELQRGDRVRAFGARLYDQVAENRGFIQYVVSL